MDLPVIVQSTHTWDTKPGSDLYGGEEAIVVSAIDYVAPDEYGGQAWSEWMLIPLERPRLVKIVSRANAETTLKRWLKPA